MNITDFEVMGLHTKYSVQFHGQLFQSTKYQLRVTSVPYFICVLETCLPLPIGSISLPRKMRPRTGAWTRDLFRGYHALCFALGSKDQGSV